MEFTLNVTNHYENYIIICQEKLQYNMQWKLYHNVTEIFI